MEIGFFLAFAFYDARVELSEWGVAKSIALSKIYFHPLIIFLQ